MVAFTKIEPQQTLFASGTVIFEPSTYNGTGLEVRKSLVLRLDEETRARLVDIETPFDLSSSVVRDEQVRVKVDLGVVQCYDQGHNKIEPPALWVNHCVDVKLVIRGIWKSSSSSGLCVSCVAVRFRDGGQSFPFREAQEGATTTETR